jgi:hypothetical protein
MSFLKMATALCPRPELRHGSSPRALSGRMRKAVLKKAAAAQSARVRAGSRDNVLLPLSERGRSIAASGSQIGNHKFLKTDFSGERLS